MTETQDNNLVSFVAKMGGDKTLKVEENLGAGFVRLRVAEAERRQAKHDIRCIEDVVVEMLRNARDAGATKIYVATTKEGTMRTLILIDDGVGIPREMHEKIFDARVTSKLETIHMDRWGVHGRGMALFSIKENTESACVLDSAPGHGSALLVQSDTEKLLERSDQSSWPTLTKDEAGELAIGKGPHNILRTCSEFALEERGKLEVYVGSPAEIAATIRRTTIPTHTATELLFIDDLMELPLLERLVHASDAQEFVRVSKCIGLDMSERTAHRILAGQLKPQRSVLAHLLHKGGEVVREVDLVKDRRGLKIDANDLEEFSRTIERDFEKLAKRYYLQLKEAPRIRVSKGKVSVIFSIDEPD